MGTEASIKANMGNIREAETSAPKKDGHTQNFLDEMRQKKASRKKTVPTASSSSGSIAADFQRKVAAAENSDVIKLVTDEFKAWMLRTYPDKTSLKKLEQKVKFNDHKYL